MCVCAEHRADVGVRNFSRAEKIFVVLLFRAWEREREYFNVYLHTRAISSKTHIRYSWITIFYTFSDDSHASHLISFEFHHIRILSNQNNSLFCCDWRCLCLLIILHWSARAIVWRLFFSSFSRQLKNSMLINGKVVRTYTHDREWDRTKIKHKKNAALSSSPCSSVPVCICCVLLTQSTS